MGKRNRKIDITGVMPDGSKVDGIVIDVSGDGAKEAAPPNYRVTPGAWIVYCLYGRIAPTPHIAYWPSREDPERISLSLDGPPVMPLYIDPLTYVYQHERGRARS